MAEVIHPPPLAQKVLALEAPGGPAVSASVVVPTLTRPGEPFDARVALADETGYPSVAFNGEVSVTCAAADPPSQAVRFRRGAPAVAVVRGVSLGGEGWHRFRTELDGRAFHSNPTRCSPDARHGVWWGDPHVHTVLSDCHPGRCRSLQFCYVAARWFAGLDWASAADHVSNGRCTLGKWKEQVAASDLHDDPPAFVTLPAYEASLKGGAGGDNNVYMVRWPETFVDEYEEGNVRTLCQKLGERLAPGREFFVVPHHTTRTGKHGEIGEAIYPGPDLMPVVEIHSKWGTSEYRGNPNPLHKIHPGPGYVADLLNAGLRLGFVGGTDTHATMPAGFGAEHLDRLPGLTAVFAPTLSRRSVFDAVRARRCYATSLERICLDVTVGGAGMGASVEWPDGRRPREVRAVAAARSRIETIDLVRNGRTIRAEPVAHWRGALAFADAADLDDVAIESGSSGRFAYYYVRVTCASGAQAWSSPVWVTAPRR